MPWFFNHDTARDEFLAIDGVLPDSYEPLRPEGREPRNRDGETLSPVDRVQAEIDAWRAHAAARGEAVVVDQDLQEFTEVAFYETINATEQYRRLTEQYRRLLATTVYTGGFITAGDETGRTRVNRVRDEAHEMPVANKEPTPQTLGDNPLASIGLLNVKYSLKLYKDILDALKAGRYTVPISFTKPRPPAPKVGGGQPYSPKYDFKKKKTFEEPFQTWEYLDNWHNRINATDVKKVPEANRQLWEDYRLKLLEWERTKNLDEDITIPWAFKFLQNRLTFDWSHAVEQSSRLVNAQPATFWEERASKYNKRHVSWKEFHKALYTVNHSNSRHDTDYRACMLLLPPEIRPKRVVNMSGNFFRRDIIGIFQKLYRIRFGEEMPTNMLFWNSWKQVVDVGTDGIGQVDNVSGLDTHELKHSVPQRYLDEHIFVPCLCCEKIADTGYMYWISPKHKEQIIFRSVANTEARRKKRQDEFLKNFKPEKTDKKYYTYPASAQKDMSKVPTQIHGIIRFLNEHIDSFDPDKRKVAKHSDVDEYGIDHRELDEKEMSTTNIKYLGNGWADTDNRKRYVMVCPQCWQRLSIRPDRGVDFGDEPLRRPRDALRRNRDAIIMRHGASPFDYLGRRFMLAKGEQRRIENEKIVDLRRGTVSLQPKDTTLYMGVELEVCPEDDLYTEHMLKRCNFNVNEMGYTAMYNDVTWVAANVVNNFARNTKKMGILTFDRSTGNGFELVTLPGTFRWHMEEAWDGFFKEDYDDPEMAALSPAAFCSGWVNNGQPTKNKFILNAISDRGERITSRPSCGIHIHFSRDAISPLQLGKIKYFINTHTKFIEQIAGRTTAQFARYVPSKIKDGTAMAKNKGGNTANLAPLEGRMDNGADRSRYVALNLNTGKPTFELRIFRANVSKAGFFKNLEFTHALIMWCGTAAPVLEKNLTVAAFVNWMEGQRGQYKWLTRWLIHHKYMSSVHKFTAGRTREYDFIDDNSENETTTKGLRRAVG